MQSLKAKSTTKSYNLLYYMPYISSNTKLKCNIITRIAESDNTVTFVEFTMELSK